MKENELTDLRQRNFLESLAELLEMYPEFVIKSETDIRMSVDGIDIVSMDKELSFTNIKKKLLRPEPLEDTMIKINKITKNNIYKTDYFIEPRALKKENSHWESNDPFDWFMNGDPLDFPF